MVCSVDTNYQHINLGSIQLIMQEVTKKDLIVYIDNWHFQRGESPKRQFFLDKLHTQQLITLSNLQVAPSNMVFLNKATAIQDASLHSIVSVQTKGGYCYLPIVPCANFDKMASGQ